MQHDLVIKGATVVDGTGAPGVICDVAVRDGIITEVGRVDGRGARELAGDGLVLTPGFVDIHTHYDGQVTWDPLLSPSCWHGVTTLVMGNCGVGFAPVRPDRRDWLVELMEGVEDIPGTALYEGIEWEWESFPEYLDALARRPRALDVAAQIPHGAVRTYVMGERGATGEAPTDDDLAAMAAIVREAMVAGAIGFSSNRLPLHTALDGTPVPGTFASEAELSALTGVLGVLGTGTVEIVPGGAMGEDLDAPARELELFGRLARANGRPLTYALTQIQNAPALWRDLLRRSGELIATGAAVVPQVQARPLGILIGLAAKHPLTGRPSFDAIAGLPRPELLARLRVPEVRAAILAERAEGNGLAHLVERGVARVFPLGDPPDYEPDPERSVAAIAGREGRDPREVLYDLLLDHDGRALLLFALGGYAFGNLDDIGEMLTDAHSVLGLGDGGAHCGVLCDASTTTYLLSHWVRDRRRGLRLELGAAVAKMTSATAALYGLDDRGVIRPGYKADFNLIDLERLQLRLPELATDLPGGARRLIQRADGYVATIVSGSVIQEEGEDTGARPGRLVRGAQAAPTG